MNEGFLNFGADYVIVRTGLGEGLGLATERYGDRVVVRVIPDDGEPYSATWPAAEARAATKLEIYQHGEARLKSQPLGPDYGANAGKAMWDVMSDQDRDYWRSLRPTTEEGRTMPNHVTYIEGPDVAGHWEWSCSGCPANASGYDEAAEVIAAATRHGPLAADSLIPTDPDDD